jgi:predicted nucleic acid-binding protein
VSYILDTDTIIYFKKGEKNVATRVLSTHPSYLNTTIINRAELLFGAYYSQHKKTNLIKVRDFLSHIKILPFCENSVEIFAEYKASLKKSGNMISDMDLMIASIAMANNMIMVTNNSKHFNRIKELKIENWRD